MLAKLGTDTNIDVYIYIYIYLSYSASEARRIYIYIYRHMRVSQTVTAVARYAQDENQRLCIFALFLPRTTIGAQRVCRTIAAMLRRGSNSRSTLADVPPTWLKI